MPLEIADSDDEVELFSHLPKTTDHVTSTAITTGLDIPVDLPHPDQDPVMNIDFDRFCSPTQPLPSSNGASNLLEPNSSALIDSSTNRFLNEFAPASSSSSILNLESTISTDQGMKGGKQDGASRIKQKAGKKRSRTQLDDDSNTAPSKSNESSSKKAKKHVSSEASDEVTGVHASMNSQHNFQPQNDRMLNDDPLSTSDLISVEARTQYTEPLDVSLDVPSIGEDTVVIDTNTSSNITREASHPRPQPYTFQPSFSASNMRGMTTSRSSMGNFQSFSIDAEGLGIDDINPFGRASQVSQGINNGEQSDEALSNIFRGNTSNRDESDPDNTIYDNLPVDSAGMDNCQSQHPLTVTPEQLFANRPSLGGSPPFSPITNPDDQVGNVLEVQELPKKRGRKPKQNPSTETKSKELQEADELHLDDQIVAREVRAGTVDSVSNVSEISYATTGSRTGKRRRSKRQDNPPPEVLSKKLPSSDLGLDNKVVIGLSPERYVPRPSRRRGRGQPEKELVSSTSAQRERHDDSSKEIVQEHVEKEVKSKKGKKGKKGKPKDVEEVTDMQQDKEIADEVDNDEKNVDHELAAVKETEMNIEDSTAEGTTGNIMGTEDIEEGECLIRQQNITIDVPKLGKCEEREDLPPMPEPKKRGRKRKTAVELPTEDNTSIVPVNQAQSSEREVLSEKDSNIQSKISESSETQVKSDVELSELKDNDENMEVDLTAQKLKAAVASTPAKAIVPSDAKAMTSSGLKPLSSVTLFNARPPAGLSKRRSIPSLLRKVDRNKEAPKAIERKEKLNKSQLAEREAERIAREEAEAEGREYVPPDLMRGKDGLLIEWDF